MQTLLSEPKLASLVATAKLAPNHGLTAAIGLILHGCALEQLKTLDANSVDAVVTDPPYGLSFMGKKWDYDVPSVELWREVLRVLKPGGHLLSFGGTRTYHRMVVNIEDAGFEIRDQVMWLYGSGFPKSLDVSKAIDKAAGAEREVVGDAKRSGSNSRAFQSEELTTAGQHFDTAPATPDARTWSGWGTALKPANEPIVLARKPLEKGLTVAENVLKWGVGAINVDASRIATDADDTLFKPRHNGADRDQTVGKYGVNAKAYTAHANSQGRWPANVLFDEEAASVLDEQSGTSKSGASRFFYVAKASKRERNAGLEGMPERDKSIYSGGIPSAVNSDPTGMSGGGNRPAANFHPTVKPVKLMEYLVRMVTPPGGIVLDPFLGSGTTGVAAKSLGFGFIGIERELQYVEIARKRIENAS